MEPITIIVSMCGVVEDVTIVTGENPPDLDKNRLAAVKEIVEGMIEDREGEDLKPVERIVDQLIRDGSCVFEDYKDTEIHIMPADFYNPKKEDFSWNIYNLYTDCDGIKYTEKAKEVTEAITHILDKLVNSINMGDDGSPFISEDNCKSAAEKINMLGFADVGATDTASREAISAVLRKKTKEVSFLSDEDVEYINNKFYDGFYV